ncbi:MAG TPA: zinc-dependent alcohol dehydrogenase [Ktedonobacteraceae bacterium]|jgi:threonine dehydrogenase-like Zn-dependent dehydrogenase|nr:zinc-dependent alcohol dehydrogenase [Ktedonobacteraceae bacterium]
MKAIVFHGIGDIRLDDVPEPKIEQPTDAIVRITASAICGTDLHMVRGTFTGMVPGTILGHEGVGVVEALGPDVRNLNVGDRVVIASTIACGYCSYCRAGYYSQCDVANPNGPQAGTAFFGGPKETGSFNGLQAEKARIPFANVGLIKLPDEVSNDEAIALSDIFPAGYQAADMANIKPGHTVVIFGCGPVGQFAIVSAKLMDAGRIFAVDTVPDRLAMARAQGAEVIDYNAEDPVEVVKRLTGGIGTDCVIDAVGVDANHAHSGPAAQKAQQQAASFQQELQQIAPQTNPQNGNWHPGDGPSQVSQWTVECIAKAGTISIIGVYPPTAKNFPIGMAMNKNLRLNMGNCNHRKYIPTLVDLVQSNIVEPLGLITQTTTARQALDAYRAFDKRESGWEKVELVPMA